MKKRTMIVLSIFTVLGIISFFSLNKINKENQVNQKKIQQEYNKNILLKTLSKQVNFLYNEKECFKERIEISESLIKHLDITNTKLKNLNLKTDNELEYDLLNKFREIQTRCNQ